MKRTPALLCTAALTAALSSTFVAGTASAAPSPQERHDAAVARADRNVANDRAAVAAGPEERFSVKDVVLDADGTEHVRYDRTYRGLPVLGGDVVVHDASDGSLRGVSRTQRSGLGLSTRPSVSAERAAEVARSSFSGTVDSVDSPRLSVLTRGAAPRLAYDTVVRGTSATGDPSELHVLVDANDASVLERADDIETARPAPAPAPTTTTGTVADATGSTLYVGSVTLSTLLSGGTYSLKDTTRGGQTTSDLGGRTSGSGTLVTSTTPTFGNGSTSNRATVAADAQYGAAQTWDYYKTTFGRNGIAGDGKGAPSRVHYGSAYNNAFWSDSCFCMTFGDGDGRQFNPLVSLDVAGHEMTHGITSRTANLTYSGESGGLNEANSDVFGTMVEFRANSPQDVPDFQIGEEIVPTGQPPLRYMYKPSLDGASKDCWYSGVGSLNVHYSSGVGNHAFFLMAQGSGGNGYGASPTCGAPAMTGIGNADAAAVWYRALTVYMTSSTDFHGARTSMLQAATDLYGAGSTQYAGVNAAWAGAGVA